MDIELTAYVAIISVVLSGIVSYFVSISLRNRDFKIEFYRLILNNRVDVYQQLQSSITALMIVSKEEVGDRVFHPEVVDPVSFQEMFSKLHKLQLNGSIWMSDELSHNVAVLLHFLRITFDGVDNVEERKQKAFDSYQVLQDRRKNIDRLLLKDMRELYRVRKFLRKRPSRFNQIDKKYKLNQTK